MTSTDGTPITFERRGRGSPLVLVPGAFGDRHSFGDLPSALATRFEVISYDRRGRGASGDHGLGYDVDLEVADLAAIVAATGDRPRIFGHSSGARLVLRAAVDHVPMVCAALYEPPFAVPGAEWMTSARAHKLLDEVTGALRHGDRGRAAELHLLGSGVPEDVVAQMSTSPYWEGMVEKAHTLPYDETLCLDVDATSIAVHEAEVPILLLGGAASDSSWLDALQRIATRLPRGRFETIAGQGHNPATEALLEHLLPFLEATKV